MKSVTLALMIIILYQLIRSNSRHVPAILTFDLK